MMKQLLFSIAQNREKVNTRKSQYPPLSLSLSLSHKRLAHCFLSSFFLTRLHAGMKRGAAALLFHLGLQNRSKEAWQKAVSGRLLRVREERREERVQLHFSRAFTIVELLIVIVIIAILAAITIISYNGITNRTKDASLKTNLSQAAKKLETEKIKSGTDTYPSTLSTAGVSQPSNIAFTYNNGGTGVYCLQGTYETYTYYVSSASNTPTQGTCPAYIQTITTATCPTTRTMVVDARDNRTYWIQKLADGKCWMLTNLAYAGGGVNVYSDTRTLTNGTADTAATYTDPKYYIPTGANPTTSPTQPSTSTDGGATNPQYGYLYNFCAANGGQTGNGACSSSSSTTVTTTISVCPTNWRLPTSNGGEFTALNTAVNSGSTSSDAGLIASPWLGQRGGYWTAGFGYQGSNGFYWSSTKSSSTNAYGLYFGSTGAEPSGVNYKGIGRAIRCLAQS